MVARKCAGIFSLARFFALLAALPTGLACVGTHEGSTRVVHWGPREGGRHAEGDTINLPEAEQMIDELDRIMTATGTIGVKSPDVWGQDRLAKFRSEYETQMAGWLKNGFKGQVNASVKRTESEARRLQVGARLADPAVRQASSAGAAAGDEPIAKTLVSLDPAAPGPADSPEKTSALLEPTVLLDEHSNYLNHLNQLRRINAGDDLTDRPGYGLYLVRIPVTLSPGPKSRRGKGAIITVSARSLMTRDTLRNTLRNAVINETVNNLTQTICNQACNSSDRSSGPGSGSFSLVSYADTEVFYGVRNIELLRSEAERELARDLADEPHHRSARIADWLRGELEASYQLLEEAAKPHPQQVPQKTPAVDPLEVIGEMVIRKDYARLAAMQPRTLGDQQVMRAGGATGGAVEDGAGAQRRKIQAILGFALRIQAAAVNRRLKQDMVDQDPSVRAEVLKTMSFFQPDATKEAVAYFERYVNAKWPLRVYAIEPVIAQQNVADGYGRRSQWGFEIAGTAPVGPLRLLNGLASAGLASERRLAEDETAIRLNPTMVGFGAGESTFGWIFYPRIQTKVRDGHMMTDIALLLRGQFPDGTGKEQSIEPGQRECTALVVMPNFVPKMEFITVANWFRTSDVVDGQKSNLEKAATWGRMLVASEEALNRANVGGKYRPEEYQIAVERLNQLRSMMPTQRLIVRVPFTDDNNDSRLFCSQGGQLRPALLAWHGRPPREGDESTILVEGKNFSVHDTHVIAGGKPAEAVLVSRNLMQVTIARDATPTPSENGNPLLDINVATPNGVSNHLLIKMDPPDPDRKPSRTEASSPRREGHSPDSPAAEVPAELEPITKETSKTAPGEAKPEKVPVKSTSEESSVVKTGVKARKP
jgi:hypothetical protein